MVRNLLIRYGPLLMKSLINNMKRGLFAVFVIGIGIIILFPISVFAETNVSLEVPFGQTASVLGLADYLVKLYTFIVTSIGVIAAIMIMFHGVQWAAAAGNSEIISKSKDGIVHAIIGVVLAFSSFAILYTINPALTQFTDPSFPAPGQPVATVNGVAAASGGVCTAPSSGTCEPTTLATVSKGCFGTHVNEAAGICKAETLGQSIPSVTDVCTDGRAFSVGLFQVNMIANGYLIPGCEKEKVYNYGHGSPGLVAGPNGTKHYDCSVKNVALYDSCRAQFIDPVKNVELACRISSNGAHWHPWSTNAKCNYTD